MAPERGADLPRLPPYALQAGPVIDAGGIFDFARREGMIKT